MENPKDRKLKVRISIISSPSSRTQKVTETPSTAPRERILTVQLLPFLFTALLLPKTFAYPLPPSVKPMKRTLSSAEQDTDQQASKKRLTDARSKVDHAIRYIDLLRQADMHLTMDVFEANVLARLPFKHILVVGCTCRYFAATWVRFVTYIPAPEYHGHSIHLLRRLENLSHLPPGFLPVPYYHFSNLTHLVLSGIHDLRHLRVDSFTKLRSLDLWYQSYESLTESAIFTQLSGLEHLGIHIDQNVFGVGDITMAAGLTNLTSLHIEASTRFTDAALALLPRLSKLELGYETGITRAGIQSTFATLTHLALRLIGSGELLLSGYPFRGLPHLTYLDLVGATDKYYGVDNLDDALATLPKLTHVRFVDVDPRFTGVCFSVIGTTLCSLELIGSFPALGAEYLRYLTRLATLILTNSSHRKLTEAQRRQRPPVNPLASRMEQIFTGKRVATWASTLTSLILSGNASHSIGPAALALLTNLTELRFCIHHGIPPLFSDAHIHVAQKLPHLATFILPSK